MAALEASKRLVSRCVTLLTEVHLKIWVKGGKLYRRKARRVILLIMRLRNPRDLRVGLSITKQVGLGCTNGASSSTRRTSGVQQSEHGPPYTT